MGGCFIKTASEAIHMQHFGASNQGGRDLTYDQNFSDVLLRKIFS